MNKVMSALRYLVPFVAMSAGFMTAQRLGEGMTPMAIYGLMVLLGGVGFFATKFAVGGYNQA